MFDALIPRAWTEFVLQLDPGEYWLAVGFLVLVALGAFWAIFHFFYRARFIEDTPTSRVRSAAQGYVELNGVGRLMTGPPIISPLSGVACTWYSYKVEEKSEYYDGRGNRRTRWQTIRSETSDDLFLLADDTGVCVVDPDGAEVTPTVKERWYGDMPMWTPGVLRGRTGWFSSGRYRYSERRMHPGDDLYAIGEFCTVGGAQDLPNTEEEMRQLLAQWKRDQVTLHARFDSNNDGVISIDEWEKARQAARREVLKAQRERVSGSAFNVLRKPKDDHFPYLLSVLPQDELVRRYRWFAGGGLALFLLAGAICSWLLAVRVTP